MEFFPFCIDTHDAQKQNLQQQAQLLKELGYSGVGHLWLDNVAERLKTLDDAGLKLYQITIRIDLAPGHTPYDTRLKDVLPLLKGRHVQFDLIMAGLRPADPAGDARAVAILHELSDLAKDSGSQLLLYPHTSDWIQSLDDAVRIAEKVDRPNVGVMFNLCHWLRVSKDRDYRPLLKHALPRLWAVSLNGADEFNTQPSWASYIQPLGRGSFDVRELLSYLREIGYRGTIGLQCYGIPGDARSHLAESMEIWRSYAASLR